MYGLLSRLRGRLDRFGVVLSALCVVHCVSGLVLVTVLGLSGSVLLSPRIHEVGLAAAIVIGGIGLGFGVARHGRRDVALLGVGGLALMAFFFVANSVLVFASLFVLRRRQPDAVRPFRVPLYPLVRIGHDFLALPVWQFCKRLR